jgi:hypothetical protein
MTLGVPGSPRFLVLRRAVSVFGSASDVRTGANGARIRIVADSLTKAGRRAPILWHAVTGRLTRIANDTAGGVFANGAAVLGCWIGRDQIAESAIRASGEPDRIAARGGRRRIASGIRWIANVGLGGNAAGRRGAHLSRGTRNAPRTHAAAPTKRKAERARNSDIREQADCPGLAIVRLGRLTQIRDGARHGGRLRTAGGANGGPVAGNRAFLSTPIAGPALADRIAWSTRGATGGRAASHDRCGTRADVHG